MRYAVFSDVHANRQAWEAVRADMILQEVETLVCLGDVIGYGPKPREVLAAVRAATPNFVLGNHDAASCGRMDPAIFNERARTVIAWTRQQLDEEALRYLREVPLQMEGPGVEFVHAEVVQPGEFGYIDGPGPAGANLRAMACPLAFVGHTHLPAVYVMDPEEGAVTQLAPEDFRVEERKRYLVNVGSVGEPRTTDLRASYVIYNDLTQTVSFRRVAFDVAGYQVDLAESGLEISPYFVRVTEAGPQPALSQLPPATVAVEGRKEQLWPAASPAPGATSNPSEATRASSDSSNLPGWVTLLLVLVVLGAIGGAAFLVSTQRRESPPDQDGGGAPAADSPRGR